MISNAKSAEPNATTPRPGTAKRLLFGVELGVRIVGVGGETRTSATVDGVGARLDGGLDDGVLAG